MSDQEPTWTRDGDFLRTTYDGFSCCVTDPPGKSHSWRWKVEKGFGQNWAEGFVDSLEIGQACALRTVEALAMLARCKKGDPPDRSGGTFTVGSESPAATTVENTRRPPVDNGPPTLTSYDGTKVDTLPMVEDVCAWLDETAADFSKEGCDPPHADDGSCESCTSLWIATEARRRFLSPGPRKPRRGDLERAFKMTRDPDAKWQDAASETHTEDPGPTDAPHCPHGRTGMCSHCGPKTTDRERREKAAADRYPDRIGDTRQQREAKTGARVDFTIGADYEALHCAGEQTAARQYAEVWQREADSAFAREDEAHAECETYRAKVAVNIVEISGLRTELAEARREVGLAVQVLRAHTETEELSATPNESPYDVACAACSNLRALRTEVDRLTRERDELQRREDARSEAIEAYRRENERRAATVGIEAHELTDVVNLLFAKIDTLTRERDTLHARVAELEAVKIDGDRAALILFVAKAREQRDALRTEVDRLTRDNEALREALDEALKACGLCHGKGHYLTSCSMCHDSTWDHECDDERRECERCTRLLALLAPTPGSEKLV